MANDGAIARRKLGMPSSQWAFEPASNAGETQPDQARRDKGAM
jgi:hypothetical protein